jgi:5-carboxymethyl-2-hydroxymuconate isomerase
MKDMVILNLPRAAVLQILDGLQYRLEIWRYTEEYMETGYVHEPYEVEDCSNPEEAKEIGDFYEEIINNIQTQLTAKE